MALWCSFLAAILVLMVVLTFVPHEGFGLAEASVTFFCSWALMLVPIALALSLAAHPGARHDR